MTNICREKLKFFEYKYRLLLHYLYPFRCFQNFPHGYVNPFKKKRKLPYYETRIASRICITILGNGAVGQPRCVGLFTDLKGYLFNCGEGVGRLCREYEVNMCTIKHVFVTQKKWENISGLHDIFITNQTYGVSQLSLHGPPGIENSHTLLSSKVLDTVLSKKSPSLGSHIDHTLEIEYVPLYCEHKSLPSTRRKYAQSLNSNSDTVFSYICNIFEKPGDLHMEKCIELGVPVGPDLLKLKNGEDIVLPSGKKIYSKDVCQPFPHTLILVVDCPSESFLQPFINERKFEKCFPPFEKAVDVPAVFHFTPPHIFSLKKYQDWIQRFPQNTLHFVLNSDNPTSSSAAVHQTQRVFHLMHQSIFDILKEKQPCKNLSSNSNILYTPPMLQFLIRPEKELNWANVLKANDSLDDIYVYDVQNLTRFIEKLENSRPFINQQMLSNGKSKMYPEILFLGTSSSTSSAFRNVSAIVVNTSHDKTILLDCGEGTMMQLTRYYGYEKVYSILRKLSCIFVSHRHTDHYMGLFEIILQRIKAFEMFKIPYERMALVIPYDTERRLKSFCEIFQNIFPFVKVFNCNYIEKNGCNRLQPFLGDIELSTVPVEHCGDSFGVVLKLKSEWKIVYSGDTAPCQKLIDAGNKCTLLIHEATVEDNLLTEALAKKHSTPSQVVDIAEKMNAKYTILTHFSKRYLAIPVLKECNHRQIAYAFDFMKTRICDLPLLPLFTPLLKCLFQEEIKEHVNKSAHVVSFEKNFLKVLKSQ